MEGELSPAASGELLPAGFALTDGKYSEPTDTREDRNPSRQQPKKRRMQPTDLATLQTRHRKTAVSLLKTSLRCPEHEALAMSVEEMLAHAHRTLEQRVAQIPDVRFMSEADSDDIRKIIFETDLFLDGSGIDMDIQYRHHLECLRMLDETDEFWYVFGDIEFQKCMLSQQRRLNALLYGAPRPPKDMSESEHIGRIRSAWGKGEDPLRNLEVFVTLYQNEVVSGRTGRHESIRAALSMKSVKRFGNIIERTTGEDDPERFLQAVADEVTDSRIGQMNRFLRHGAGRAEVAAAVIRCATRTAFDRNLALAICHPAVETLTGESLVRRVQQMLPDAGTPTHREEMRRAVEQSIRDGTCARERFTPIAEQQLLTEVTEHFRAAAAEIEAIVEQAEAPYRGFYPVGAKVHFPQSVPKEKLVPLFHNFGFSLSGFSMQHADSSMLLPPRRSATEIVTILEELKRRGFIDGETEIQTCIPGRLNNQYAAILGSSMLLSSFLCVTYARDSFQTSHNQQTASMIMAYDGGELDRSVAELPGELRGRTDMLGRKDVRDVYLYQILGSLISQSVYGGPFQNIGREFILQYVALLKREDMLDVLRAQWVNDEKSAGKPDTEGHYLAIKRCTDTWLGDDARFRATGKQEGLTFDVLRVLTRSLDRAKIEQVRLGLVASDGQRPLLPHNT